MPFKQLNQTTLGALHDGILAERALSGGTARQRFAEGVWHWIERNHVCNAMLWDEEDRARQVDVPDEEIVRCKRSIDRLNQQRNDAVEAIDDRVLEMLGLLRLERPAKLHSETPGAMMDRLSILSLKVHHMRLQTEREDADAQHIARCAAKLERLAEQRSDLGGCFDALLEDLVEGRARFKVYRQFKMYNDPSLNPFLYRSKSATATLATG
jgi:hypothetical protein